MSEVSSNQRHHDDQAEGEPRTLRDAYQRLQQEANSIELRLQGGGDRLSKAELQLLTRLLNELRSQAEAKREAWLRSVHGKTD